MKTDLSLVMEAQTQQITNCPSYCGIQRHTVLLVAYSMTRARARHILPSTQLLGKWWLWKACWVGVGLGNRVKWQRAGGCAVKHDRWPLWRTHTAPEDTILPSILFTHSLSSFILLTTPAILEPTCYLHFLKLL